MAPRNSIPLAAGFYPDWWHKQYGISFDKKYYFDPETNIVDVLVHRLRAKVDDDAKQLGVDIVDVRLKRVDFAPEVQERVFDRMQSERKRVANERRATGSAESEKIRADADRQREVLLAEAYRDAQKIKGEGDAKASAIYAQAFGQNPEFAQFYRSLDAYRTTFDKRSDVLVIDKSADFFRFMNGTSGTGGGRQPAPQR